MPRSVKIEEHFVDKKRIYITKIGDNQYVGLLANALHLAAHDGYRLVDTLENQRGEVVLFFERDKDSGRSPVMRKR